MTDSEIWLLLLVVVLGPVGLLVWWRGRTLQRTHVDQETQLMHAVTDTLQRLRQGDLEARVDVKGRALGREVADFVNKLLDDWGARFRRASDDRDRLQSEVTRLQDLVANVGRGLGPVSAELDSVIDGLGRSAQGLQRGATTWATVEQVHTAAAQLATDARAAAQSSAQAATTSAECARALATLHAIHASLEQSTKTTTTQLARVDADAQATRGALGAIASTATRLGVLAVNASLAAARGTSMGAPLLWLATETDAAAQQAGTTNDRAQTAAATLQTATADAQAALAPWGAQLGALASAITATQVFSTTAPQHHALASALEGLAQAASAQLQTTTPLATSTGDIAALARDAHQLAETSRRIRAAVGEALRHLPPNGPPLKPGAK